MFRRTATAVAAAVVFLAVAGCSAPTEPRYPKDREEDPKPGGPPPEASLTLPAPALFA